MVRGRAVGKVQSQAKREGEATTLALPLEQRSGRVKGEHLPVKQATIILSRSSQREEILP
jgi:hypothetical protein